MTFKIESWKKKEITTVFFEGFLDAMAILNLKQECEGEIANGKKVKLIFRKGTAWDLVELNEVLQWESITFEAESPLLKYILNKRTDC